MKLFRIFSLCIFLSHSLISCASVPVGFGYVNQKDVQAYSKPSLKSEVLFALDKAKKFELLAYDVPDKDSSLKLLWFKVRQNDKVGYISREEESLKKSISNFLPVLRNKYGLVTATQLMLRESPGTNGKVLGKLPTREIIELQEEQTSTVTIDGMTGTWAKVKTKTGQVGFVFTAYVMRDSSPEILAGTKDIDLLQTGWAYVKKDPKRIYQYKGGKLIPSDEIPSYVSEGSTVYFNRKLITEKGKVYFNLYGIDRPYGYSDYHSDDTEVAYSGYLPAEVIDTYPTFVRLYISTYKGSHPKDLLEAVGKSLNDGADLENMEVEEHVFGKKKIFQVKVPWKTNNVNADASDKITILFYKDNANYVLIHKGTGDIEFSDLDGDNISEILATDIEGRSGAVNQTLYRFNGSSFETIATFSGGGYENEGECGKISISGSSIFRSSDNCKKTGNALYSPFEFRLKKGKLVPGK